MSNEFSVVQTKKIFGKIFGLVWVRKEIFRVTDSTCFRIRSPKPNSPEINIILGPIMLYEAPT